LTLSLRWCCHRYVRLFTPDVGEARLLQPPTHLGAAYFLVGGPADQVEAGKPLVYPDIHVTRLDSPEQYYDLTEDCGTGREYTVSVDAREAHPFGGVNAYSAPGRPGSCS
jgi:hypothetical protein